MDSVKKERIKSIKEMKKTFQESVEAFKKQILFLEKRIKECDEEVALLSDEKL